MKLKSKRLTPDQELSAIRKKLGYLTLDLPVRYWLDTGSHRLNSVVGSPEKGLAYGKLLELFGPESNGKTLLALYLGGKAQEDGASVAWVDGENSYDKVWAAVQGVNTDRIYVFVPRVGVFGREKVTRLQTAEELCTEVEVWMSQRHKAHPEGKLCVVVDSVRSLLVEEEAEAGLTGSNMRTTTSQSRFLSRLLRRWVALALNYNALIIFINHLLTAPGVVYGNPEYTPGGRALKFYSSIRVKVRRIKGGKLIHKGKTVGLRAVVTNVKNKAGEGSIEGETCGFKSYFGKNAWRFMSLKKLKRDAGDAGVAEE